MSALAMRRTGLVLTVLVALFMAIDAGGKLFAPKLMIANSPPLGLPVDIGFCRLLGSILAVCTVLYSIPRTALLGAILLTGYLGGAVASHLRVGSPLIGFTLFGVYLGIILWAALWFRLPAVRGLLPLRINQGEL
ncbi:MAG TPA: DoxX family protein [Novosphingobium sp.]|nr:DoxX family protein [Novosphingobium sp.]